MCVMELMSKRDGVLGQLADGEKTKPELVEELPISRSTVDRAMNELLESRCVCKSASSFQLTEFGRVAFEMHDSYVQWIRTADEASDLLTKLPLGTVDPIVFSEDPAVEMADLKRPEEVFQTVSDAVEMSTEFTATVPVAFSAFFDVIETAAVDEEVTVELLVDGSLYDRLAGDEASTIDRLERADGVSTATADLPTTHSVFVGTATERDVAGLIVHRRGRLDGVIVTDSPRGVKWAIDKYDSFREDGIRGPNRAYDGESGESHQD